MEELYRRAGVVRTIPHDLRRCAVRNFVSSNVGDKIGMALSGYKEAEHQRCKMRLQPLSGLQKIRLAYNVPTIKANRSRSSTSESGWMREMREKLDRTRTICAVRKIKLILSYCFPTLWGRSSVGRALESHSRGRGFDPHRLHHSGRAGKLTCPFVLGIDFIARL